MSFVSFGCDGFCGFFFPMVVAGNGLQVVVVVLSLSLVVVMGFVLVVGVVVMGFVAGCGCCCDGFCGVFFFFQWW